VRWFQSGLLRSVVEAEAAKVMRRAQELAPRNEGRMIPSIPIMLDPTLTDRGVIDVPADVDADQLRAAFLDAAEEGIRTPAVLTRKANGEPVLAASPGWYAPPGCLHATEVEVDSIVTGEILARYCADCGRIEYAEGW
jgi:hypothetical protein